MPITCDLCEQVISLTQKWVVEQTQATYYSPVVVDEARGGTFRKVYHWTCHTLLKKLKANKCTKCKGKGRYDYGSSGGPLEVSCEVCYGTGMMVKGDYKG